ncbi:MAG: hypothetical protein JO099_17560 [Acidobacteriia bacterium]|nr:hypothetical protein [Terriglobia bacterium]
MKGSVQSLLLVFLGAAAAFAQSGTPTISGVENQGNFKSGESLAPGAFIGIVGTNFASGLTLAETIPLSMSLAGVSVTFNNVQAPMIGVVNTQINAQVPWEVLSNGATSGTAQVVVKTGSATSAPATVNIVAASPSLLALTGTADNTGVIRPIAYNNSDNSLAFPPNAYPAGTFQVTPRPAKVNDPTSLVLLATGLGAVQVTPPDGAPPAHNPDNTIATPTVLVGGAAAKVIFSGLSPQFPSLYQLNIVLDPSTPTGNAVPVIIQMNGLQSRPDLMIAVSD